jgi:hypothetical protein
MLQSHFWFAGVTTFSGSIPRNSSTESFTLKHSCLPEFILSYIDEGIKIAGSS